MRRNRKDDAKKERIIMIASSAFVLTALTMTGVYMQSRDQESENDGYTIDFSALENNVDNKSQEILGSNLGDGIVLEDEGLLDGMNDDLEYFPVEAGSNLIEIPGLTDDEEEREDGKQSDGPSNEGMTTQVQEPVTNTRPEEVPADEPSAISISEEQTSGENVVAVRNLHFSESSGLIRPIAGEFETLIPFSREMSVYFRTLNHYKRNYSMVISAAQGTAVTACAEGRVINIFENEEIGHAVTMEIGDGYQITYGQLRDIRVAMGSYVDAGETIASVAAPTKYYFKEGDNLYLQVTSNGTAIDPAPLLH